MSCAPSLDKGREPSPCPNCFFAKSSREFGAAHSAAAEALQHELAALREKAGGAARGEAQRQLQALEAERDAEAAKATRLFTEL